MIQLFKYLNDTSKGKMSPLADNLHIIKRYTETSFNVHSVFKWHMGGFITLRGGDIQYISYKQKLNNPSSTEA